MRWNVSLALLLVSAGCASPHDIGWPGAAPTENLTAQEQREMLVEGEKDWAHRDDRSSLIHAMEKFSKVAAANPGNYEVQELLCRGYYLLADSHTDDMDEKKKFWELSIAWGQRAMATNPDFRRRVVDGHEPMENALDALKKSQVDAVYWTAASVGKWTFHSGTADRLANRNKITKLIQRVEQLDPDYFYGAVNRYWGMYYAVAPFIAGGSMQKSLEHFRRAFKAANNYFGSHVLFAETYAARKADKALFRRELEFVLKGRPESLPDIVPEQMLEQKKAKHMLETIDNYF
jgi:hypothetical protein